MLRQTGRAAEALERCNAVSAMDRGNEAALRVRRQITEESRAPVK